MIDVEIPEAMDGERIDRLVAMICECTRAEASGAIAAGTVLLSGRTVHKPSHRVRAGQRIEVTASPVIPEELPVADPSVSVDVRFVDDEVIVIHKPPGLVVHPGAGHSGETLVHGLLALFPELAGVGEPRRPGIVHRLDKGTSGLMVVARTPNAYDELVGQLSTHEVTRRYAALVWGHLDTTRTTIDAPIGRSRNNPLTMTVAADGRPSRTHVVVDETFDDPHPISLLTCELETGRTHQIRVHLRSIGRPVIGDDTYGGERPSLRISRPFLHAGHLRFDHPLTGEPTAFDAALPDDLQAVLDDLRSRRATGTAPG